MTPKQDRFVHEYLVDLNATQAARRAGYSPTSARQTGSALLRTPAIAAAIDAARLAVVDETTASRAWIVARLIEIVGLCMTPGPTWNPSSANKALELLGRERKMFVDRRLLGVRKIDDMSEAELLEFLGGEPDPGALTAAAAGGG